MVKTDIHYPTDINLLFDAMRKLIELIARLCEKHGVSGWRQSSYAIRKLKRLYRAAQQLKRSKAKSAQRVEQKERRIKEAHREYIGEAKRYVARAKETIKTLSGLAFDIGFFATLCAIDNYLEHAERQIDQIKRRVLDGDTIRHEEKVFSIFEPYTEWISKGKAGVPQELGLKVCIVEDQHHFLLAHRVMRNCGDEEVAVPIVEEAKEHFPTLESCSFDKGFYSTENKKRLSKIVQMVVLPKKGKLSEAHQLEESQREFSAARHQHSAVESAIEALENHGLDRCLDNGLEGFERYVALAVVARNIQVLGRILWKRERQRASCKPPPRHALTA